MGVPGGPEVSDSVKKNRTWTLRSSFERHEMRVGWRGHSDQKSSDSLKGRWEPDEAGGRLERDFICDGCPQGSAAYGMNFSSNHRECDVLGNHVLVALQYYKADCETVKYVRSQGLSEISRKADRGSPRRSGFRISAACMYLT
jgi:hypothetical protein